MRTITLILICFFISISLPALAQEPFNLKKQYECVVRAIQFYASGGKIFSQKGCDIETEDSWDKGNILIISNTKKGKNPVITYSLRANFPKYILISGEINEVINQFNEQYKALSECVAFFTQKEQKRDHKALNPLYKKENTLPPQHCDKSEVSGVTTSATNKVIKEEKATKIISNESPNLDFIINILKRY